MSKLITAFAVSMVAAAAAASAYPQHVPDPVVAGEGVPETLAMAPDVFELAAPGQARCNVRRGAQRSGPAAELIFDGVCTVVYPALARATVWREAPDGSVVFADPGGHTVVEFSSADGEGYESVVPAAQLLHLVPTGHSAGAETTVKG